MLPFKNQSQQASKITVSTTALSLLGFINAAAGTSAQNAGFPARMTSFDLFIESGAVRFFINGDTPTSTYGMPLSAGVYCFRNVPVSKMKLIRTGGSDAVISVTVGESMPGEGSGLIASFPAAAASGGSSDTEFPAATATTDNYANPTTTDVKSFGMLWDGAAWDRAPGNSTDGALVNLGANNDVTVTGSVTANAGTNLNTSLLALESGGNLAAAATSLGLLDNTVSGNELQVDVLTSPETNKAATSSAKGSVSVDATAGGTALIAANASRRYALIQNRGGVDIYVGTGTVDSNDIKVSPGGDLMWETQEAVKALSSSGTVTVNFIDLTN